MAGLTLPVMCGIKDFRVPFLPYTIWHYTSCSVLSYKQENLLWRKQKRNFRKCIRYLSEDQRFRTEARCYIPKSGRPAVRRRPKTIPGMRFTRLLLRQSQSQKPHWCLLPRIAFFRPEVSSLSDCRVQVQASFLGSGRDGKQIPSILLGRAHPSAWPILSLQ